MSTYKRKLSSGETASLNVNSDNTKKQRYAASLLFKPNISSKPKNKDQVSSDDALIKSSNFDGSGLNNQMQINEPPLPKLSIKRKVNRESNVSEFTIETKNISSNEDIESSADENEDDYSDEENDDEIGEEVEGEEGEEGLRENITSQNEETNDTSSSNLDTSSSSTENSSTDDNSDSESNESESDDGNNLVETSELIKDGSITEGNESATSSGFKNYPLQFKLKSSKKSREPADNLEESLNELKQDSVNQTRKRLKVKQKQDSQESSGENQDTVKIKGKRGRKPGYRKYPEGYVKPQKQSAINKTPRTITSYFLFCQVNRPKIAEKNPELKLRAQQRIVSDMWNKLTDKERLIWRQKAIKLSKKGSKGMISTGVVNQTPIRQAAATKQSHKTVANTIIHKTIPAETKDESQIPDKQQPPEESTSLKTIPIPPNLVNFNEDCKPIDLAAYLSILGESMTNFGSRLKMHEGKFAVQGASFVLLDAFLCALGPIFCLTTQIEEMNGCPKETIMKILDNISVLMPGS